MFKNVTETYIVLEFNEDTPIEVVDALNRYNYHCYRFNESLPEYRNISVGALVSMIANNHPLSDDLVTIKDYLIQHNVTSCRVYYQ